MQGPSFHVQRGRMRRSTLLAVQPKAQTRVGPWRRPVVARAVTAAALPDDQGLFVLQRARQWLSWDSDSSTRAVIQRLVDANDLKELSTLFSTRLEFGKRS